MPTRTHRNRWRVRGEITSRREVIQRTITVTLVIILVADLVDLGLNLIYAPQQIVRSAVQTTFISGVLGTIVVYTSAMANYKLYQMKAHLAELNRLDPHTGLLNRRAFIEVAESVLMSDKPHALMLVDIDAFKHINDTHGHPVGDHVIVTLAQLMRNSLAPRGEVARMGGEEFAALLLPSAQEDALHLASELVARVAATDFSTGGEPLHITISAGVAPLRPGMSFAEVYARADQAMYRSKAAGGNRATLAA